MWTKEQIPVLRMLAVFIIGIVLVYYIPVLAQWYFYFGLAGLLLAIFTGFKQKGAQFYIWLAFLFLGMAIMGKIDKLDAAARQQEGNHIRVSVIKDKSAQENRGLQMDLLLLPDDLKIKAYSNLTETESFYEIGDTLIFVGTLNAPKSASSPWGFDFKEYLNRQNTYYTTYIKEGKLLDHKKHNGISLLRFASGMKGKAIKILKDKLPDNSRIDLVKSITFGDKSSLDRTIRDQMQTAGLMHIMAVSGLHIGIVYLFVSCLFLPFKRWKIARSLLIVLGIWLFIIVCGLPASAVRAGIMLTVYESGKQFKRSPHRFNVLGIAAFIILLIDPFQLFQIGFQFSFLAITGIFFFYDKIEKFLLGHTQLPSYLCSSFSMSIAAQGILGPLCLYYFGYLSYWFWLWTLLAIPMTMAIMIGSIMTIGLSLLGLGTVGDLVAYVPGYAAYGIEFIGALQSRIPINGLVLHVPWYFMLSFMGLLVAFIIHTAFDYSLRKFLLCGSFIWLLIFTTHRTMIKQESGIYAFTAFDESHILVKNGKKGLIIGDSLSHTTRLNLEAHLAIERWTYLDAPIFKEDMELVVKGEDVEKFIALISKKKGVNKNSYPTIYKGNNPDDSYVEVGEVFNISNEIYIHKY